MYVAGQNCRPWSSCDRETRLAAFGSLPRLLDVLLGKLAEGEAAAEKALETARTDLEKLKP
jgi:hypothetical protein